MKYSSQVVLVQATRGLRGKDGESSVARSRVSVDASGLPGRDQPRSGQKHWRGMVREARLPGGERVGWENRIAKGSRLLGSVNVIGFLVPRKPITTVNKKKIKYKPQMYGSNTSRAK